MSVQAFASTLALAALAPLVWRPARMNVMHDLKVWRALTCEILLPPGAFSSEVYFGIRRRIVAHSRQMPGLPRQWGDVSVAGARHTETEASSDAC